MSNTSKSKQYAHRYYELPSVNKLVLLRVDAAGDEYAPLTLFLSKANKLISVEFQGGIPEKIAKYYFKEDQWVSMLWETESEAMKAPLDKDYPIRLLKPEQADVTRAEGLKIAKDALRHRPGYRNLIAQLRKILSSSAPDASEVEVLQAELLQLILAGIPLKR